MNPTAAAPVADAQRHDLFDALRGLALFGVLLVNLRDFSLYTLMSDAGLLTPEPGEGRRIRYRLRTAPVQLAQQFLAALASDWDGRLDALRQHLGTG